MPVWLTYPWHDCHKLKKSNSAYAISMNMLNTYALVFQCIDLKQNYGGQPHCWNHNGVNNQVGNDNDDDDD